MKWCTGYVGIWYGIDFILRYSNDMSRIPIITSSIGLFSIISTRCRLYDYILKEVMGTKILFIKLLDSFDPRHLAFFRQRF